MPETLSRLPERRFWGWGYADEHLEEAERERLYKHAARLAGAPVEAVSEPRLEEFDLRPPRVEIPASLAGYCSASAYDRLSHSYGKSYPDILRMLLRSVPNPPDWVAFPKNEQQIGELLDWAQSHSVAVIPYGGGSSVCGGVEAAVPDGYEAVLSLDMQYFNAILEVDRESRAARIQGGIFGPELEAGLRPQGLTLRHFPQSFQFSTLGGWIATRSGGHYASLYTHIDDFVESMRVLTPRGVLETRRLPGSGAGPSADRLFIGSEGSLGIITEAWMRLQDTPVFRASASVEFDDMPAAVSAVRELTQAGLFPTNCRLLDAAEARANAVTDSDNPVLVLGFESADHPLNAWMSRALELVADAGGRYDSETVERSLSPAATDGSAEHRRGASGQWRNAFIRMPYYRDLSTALGMIVDTFETAVPWNGFENLYRGVRERIGGVLRELTGGDAEVSCRFTHVYPDGPAPYFTYSVMRSDGADLAGNLSCWRDIKQATNEAVVALGGTVTHHHAVGRDHRSGYEQQTSALFRSALAGCKQRLDPASIMNPGVLIDAPGHPSGTSGAMAEGFGG